MLFSLNSEVCFEMTKNAKFGQSSNQTNEQPEFNWQHEGFRLHKWQIECILEIGIALKIAASKNKSKKRKTWQSCSIQLNVRYAGSDRKGM